MILLVLATSPHPAQKQNECYYCYYSKKGLKGDALRCAVRSISDPYPVEDASRLFHPLSAK